MELKDLIKSKKKLIISFLIAILIRIFIAIIHIFYWSTGILFDAQWNQLIINTLEPYLDYLHYYRTFAYNFVYGGWIPYLSHIYYDSTSIYFRYPPFFLYAISLPAIISIDLVFLPLFLADILLPFVVYKTLIKTNGQKIAEWGFLVTALCPLTIFYNGGLFLNTSLVTLFFVLSLYFFSINRFKWAVFTLSVAFLFKQTVIFFILPLILYAILQSTEKKQSTVAYFKKAFLYFGIFIGTLFLGSLPWILLAPLNYINALSMGQSPTFEPIFKSPGSTCPIQWYSFLIPLGAPYWLLYIVGFLNFTLLGILIVEIVDLLLLSHWHRKKELDWLKILDLIVYTAILSHLFFSRGVYKYYFTFHIPLIVLWICFHYSEALVKNAVKQKRLLFLFIGISLIILIIHRFFYLLIIWIIFFVMVKKNLKLNMKNLKNYLS